MTGEVTGCVCVCTCVCYIYMQRSRVSAVCVGGGSWEECLKGERMKIRGTGSWRQSFSLLQHCFTITHLYFSTKF